MKHRLALAISTIAALFFVPGLAEANSGDFSGGAAIGTGYAAINAGPINGLIVQGNVGIGTASASYPLVVIGSASIGGNLFSEHNRLERPGADHQRRRRVDLVYGWWRIVHPRHFGRCAQSRQQLQFYHWPLQRREWRCVGGGQSWDRNGDTEPTVACFWKHEQSKN